MLTLTVYHWVLTSKVESLYMIVMVKNDSGKSSFTDTRHGNDNRNAVYLFEYVYTWCRNKCYCLGMSGVGLLVSEEAVFDV